MASNTTTYGSIPDHTDHSYKSAVSDATHDRFPEFGEAAAATADSAYQTLPRPRRMRGVAVVPLIIAVLIVGGAATFLMRNFDSLYPGQGPRTSYESPGTTTTPLHAYGDDESDSSPREYDETSTSSSTTKTTSTVVDTAEASCEVHPSCGNLTGQCCPTAEGVMLTCC